MVKKSFDMFSEYFEGVGFSNPNELKAETILSYIKENKDNIDLIIISYFLTDSTFEEIQPKIREITDKPIICLTSETDRHELIEILKADPNAYKVMKIDTSSILNVSAYILELEKELDIKFNFDLKSKVKK
jgi:DNA-binding NarL/FixJ family response regulator